MTESTLISANTLVPSVEAILNAAEQLIFAKGFAGFSMRELARESGLAKGTIYHYFRDKQEIYISVLERDLQEVSDRVAAAAYSPGGSVQNLQAVVQTYFDLVGERRSLLMVALRADMQLHNQLRALLQRHRSAVFQPIAQLIERGIREEHFRPVDVEMTVISLLGMVNGFLTQHLIDGQAARYVRVVEHTLNLFLSGIGAPAADGRARDATQPTADAY